VLGSAVVGSVSAAGWRDAYAPPAGARCDLARGYATAALLAPAGRNGHLASEEATPGMLEPSGASTFVRTRQANLGFGAAMQSLSDMNGPRTANPRQDPFER
jgi:hypothetical protein